MRKFKCIKPCDNKQIGYIETIVNDRLMDNKLHWYLLHPDYWEEIQHKFKYIKFAEYYDRRSYSYNLNDNGYYMYCCNNESVDPQHYLLENLVNLNVREAIHIETSTEIKLGSKFVTRDAVWIVMELKINSNNFALSAICRSQSSGYVKNFDVIEVISNKNISITS